MRSWKIAGAALAAIAALSVLARADYVIPIPAGQTTPVFAFVCFVTKQCPSHVLIDSTGAEKGTIANPLQTASRVHQLTPLGFQQLSSLSASAGLTAPAGATLAMICVENQAIRYRDDGTPPTASVGMPAAPYLSLISQPNCFQYSGSLSGILFIEQNPGASIDVSYYK